MGASQHAKNTLLRHGFIECMHAASNRDGITSLCFKRQHDERPVCYGSETVEDLFALVALVESSA
jgi:carbon starvation protein CstA